MGRGCINRFREEWVETGRAACYLEVEGYPLLEDVRQRLVL